MHFLKHFLSTLFPQLPILLFYFVLIPSAQSEALVMPLEEVSIYIQAKAAVPKGCDKGNAARLLQQGASINYHSQNRAVINRVMVWADKTHPFLAGNKRYQYTSGTVVMKPRSR